jgi:hypothetical protein
MPSTLSLFVATLMLVFAGLVWRASPQRLINRRFTAFAVSSACRAVGVGAAHTGYRVEFWTAIAFGAAGFSSASFLAFIAAHDPADRWPSRSLIRAVLGLAGLFALLSVSTTHIFYGAQLTAEGIRRNEGSFYRVFALFVFLSWGTAFALLVSKWLDLCGYRWPRNYQTPTSRPTACHSSRSDPGHSDSAQRLAGQCPCRCLLATIANRTRLNRARAASGRCCAGYSADTSNA